MASDQSVSREHYRCADEGCTGEAVVITTPLSREVFVSVSPAANGETPADQAAHIYRHLPALLDRAGVGMADVVLERVFFRDVETDFDAFTAARANAYNQSGVSRDRLPVTTYLRQPPCDAGRAFELQVQAVASHNGGTVRVESFPEPEPRTAQKIVQIGDLRHLYIANINGAMPDGSIPADFREQADRMFAKSAPMLAAHGVRFPEVFRTWCYLTEIDRDYAEFNASRTTFFQQENVHRLPASTGIYAGLHPAASLCSFDLYALLNPEGVAVEVMHTPTLNEANDYGSAFSRGMKVVLPEKTVLYVSGTASIDEHGTTLHVGDFQKQAERTLLNVHELLRHQGADFPDIVQAMTYLKHTADLPTFRAVCDRWQLVDVPNTLVEAGVCRPELLCEIEAIAVIPTV